MNLIYNEKGHCTTFLQSVTTETNDQTKDKLEGVINRPEIIVNPKQNHDVEIGKQRRVEGKVTREEEKVIRVNVREMQIEECRHQSPVLSNNSVLSQEFCV